MFGRTIRDVGVLRSRRAEQLPFTVNQFLDVMSNTEARLQYQAQLLPTVRMLMKETALTTRYIETSFSRLMGNMSSGEKLTSEQIKGLVKKLDAFLKLMRDSERTFTILESRRKRKFSESADLGWNDNDAKKRAMWEKDLAMRVKGYVGGRAPSVRDHNASAGGVGKR